MSSHFRSALGGITRSMRGLPHRHATTDPFAAVDFLPRLASPAFADG